MSGSCCRRNDQLVVSAGRLDIKDDHVGEAGDDLTRKHPREDPLSAHRKSQSCVYILDYFGLVQDHSVHQVGEPCHLLQDWLAGRARIVQGWNRHEDACIFRQQVIDVPVDSHLTGLVKVVWVEDHPAFL